MQDAMFFISIMYHYALKCGEVVKHWEFFGGAVIAGWGMRRPRMHRNALVYRDFGIIAPKWPSLHWFLEGA